jgi:hypothetical protein
VHYLWDYKKRNVYNPYKEGLELFLKEVGGNSPFYYENTDDRIKIASKKSNAYLYQMWREVMGLDNTTGIHDRLRTIEPFYWFAELEHLITNDEMFWTLMTDVWCNKSEVFTDNLSILERYGRSKVSLERRLECVEHLKIILGKNELSEHRSSKGFMLKLIENDEITLYRSFKVEKGKSVRKGVKKNNNPDYYKQEEGRGWSYSMNKTNSIFINGLLGTFFYKNYLNMNDEEATIQLKKKRDLSEYKMKDITINDNFYNCIGTYTVKRKDIMFMTDDWGEMEVVVNPKYVKLIDYRFLNIFDAMTSSLVLPIVSKMFGRSGVLNIDYLYNLFRKLVRKVVIDEPKSIIQYLTGKRWSDKVHDLIFEGGKSFSYRKFEHKGCYKYIISICDEEESDISQHPMEVNQLGISTNVA